MSEKMKAVNKKDRGSKARSWFVVCPNVDTNGVCGAGAKDIEGWTEQEICEYVVNQWCSTDKKQAACLYCVSKEGMRHLHIVLCGKSQYYFDTIKRFMGDKAHIEMTKGNKEQVEEYINKTGRFDEKGETILAKAQKGELIGGQGFRTDLERIREALEEGMSWEEVRRLDDRFFDSRMTAQIKNMYFDMRKQETPLKRHVRVHWIFGDSGSGKTGTLFSLEEEYGADNIFIVSDYLAPFDGYAGQPVLLMDEFRGQLQYSVLLDVTEGYRKQVHCRNANALSLWNEVYITTIKTPEQVYTKMIDKEEADKDPISQLLGRITDISYCYKVNRADGTKTDRDGEPCEFYRYTITGKLYRELKATKEENRVEKVKKGALIEYMVKYQRPGDRVESFGIGRRGET